MTRLKTVLLVLGVGAAAFLAVFLPATTAQAEEENPYSNDEASWVLELLNRLGNEVYQTGSGWFDPPSIDDINDIVSRGLAPVSTGINSAKDSVELICDSVSGGLSWASAPLCSLVVRDESKLLNDFGAGGPSGFYFGTNVISRHMPDPYFGQQNMIVGIEVHTEATGATLIRDLEASFTFTLSVSGHQNRAPVSSTYGVRVTALYRDETGALYRAGNSTTYNLTGASTFQFSQSFGTTNADKNFAGFAFIPSPLTQDDVDFNASTNDVTRGTTTGTFARWHPEGDPDLPVGGDVMTIPRKLFGSLVCDDGTSQTTVESDHEFEFKIGLLFPSLPKLDCPEGSRVSSYKIGVRTGTEETILVDKHVPDSIKNMSQGEGTSLWWRDENGKWTNCVEDPNSCRYWDKVPAWMDKYACIKDGVKVAPGECDWLKHAFDNPDKPIGLISDPISRLNKPDPPPVKPPLDNPDWPDFSQMPGQGSGESSECFPRGWGILNPVDWVVKPIECLFTPSLNLGDMIDDRSDDLHDTLFGEMLDLMEMVGGLFNPPNHHRCGLLVDVELDTLNPLGASGNRVQVDTCTGPFAEGDSFRPILGAGFIIAALFVAATTLLRVLKVGVGGLGAGE